jgi:hypothetical protein
VIFIGWPIPVLEPLLIEFLNETQALIGSETRPDLSLLHVRLVAKERKKEIIQQVSSDRDSSSSPFAEERTRNSLGPFGIFHKQVERLLKGEWNRALIGECLLVCDLRDDGFLQCLPHANTSLPRYLAVMQVHISEREIRISGCHQKSAA